MAHKIVESKELAAIDLFCGIGGLTHGLERSGIKVVAGIDSDLSCKYAYEANNDSIFIGKDISHVTGKDLNELYPENSIRILVGCAPCQTFSQHTFKYKTREEDVRWGLLYQFLRLIKESNPDIVSMENVPQIKNYEVFSDFVNGLRINGYFVHYRVVNCARYGIPQNRKRLILLASKHEGIKLIPEINKPQDCVTLKQAIGSLPSIEDGEVHDVDKLHKSWKLSPINKERIKQSKPGGTWLDWDKRLLLNCHKKKGGFTYKTVYGRMEWDKPASTITTQFFNYGTGRFGHPSQDRALSLREGALLQTFPKSYIFVPKGKEISFSEIGRYIGNALPVKLGKVIARSIKNHVRCQDYEKR